MKVLKKMVAVAALSLPLATFAQEAAKPADPPKITVTPYGIASLALYKNDGVFAAQDYPAYVASETEGAMVISAKQSRFGINANVPLENLIGATVTGKIEADFMGGGQSSYTNANVRLRHAFMNADVAAGPGKFSILAGQTDGLLNALHPESTSYLANPLFQQAGNLHRRTGQIRLGYAADLDSVVVKVEGAILNPTSAPPGTDLTYNVGNRSGMGDLEGRLGVTMKPISDIGGTIGVSYHTGTRTYDGTAAGTTEDVTQSAFGVDADIALTQYLSVRGEYFSGEGLDDAYAGIATVSVGGAAGARAAVKSSGYWAQAIIKPIPVIYLLAGLGNETVDEATYPTAATAQRMQNDMMHAGLLLNMNKAWRVGLEWVQTTTKSRANSTSAGADLKASQLSLSTQLRF